MELLTCDLGQMWCDCSNVPSHREVATGKRCRHKLRKFLDEVMFFKIETGHVESNVRLQGACEFRQDTWCAPSW